MAGLDNMYDARGDIENYIEQKIRDLLEKSMNEYQDPNWVQAATLFKQLIVPLDYYKMGGLAKLAQDIVNFAEQNNTQVIYQDIPGLYNQKIVDGKSIENDKLPDNIQVIKYDEIVDNIKKWIENQKKLKKEFNT